MNRALTILLLTFFTVLCSASMAPASVTSEDIGTFYATPGTSPIRVAAFHPTATGTIWILTPSRIYKTTDYGDNWAWTGDGSSFGSGIDSGDIAATSNGSLATSLSDPSILYAGLNKSIYKSTDGAETWTKTATPWGSSVEALTVAVSPSNPNDVYASGNGSGSYRSTDGGATWAEMTLPSTYAYKIFVSPTNPNILYAGTNSGVFRSDDKGITWTAATGTTLTGSKFSPQIVGNPCDTQTVYDTYRSSTIGNSMYVTNDSGSNWTDATSHFPSSDSTALATAPGYESLLYQWASGSSALRRSDDGGTTWTTYLNITGSSGEKKRPLVDPTDERRVLLLPGVTDDTGSAPLTLATGDGSNTTRDCATYAEDEDGDPGSEGGTAPTPSTEITSPTENNSAANTSEGGNSANTSLSTLLKASKKSSVPKKPRYLKFVFQTSDKATTKFKVTTIKKKKTIVLAQGTRTYTKAGNYTVKLKLTKKGAKLIKLARKKNSKKKLYTIKATSTDNNSKQATTSLKVKLVNLGLSKK